MANIDRMRVRMTGTIRIPHPQFNRIGLADGWDRASLGDVAPRPETVRLRRPVTRVTTGNHVERLGRPWRHCRRCDRSSSRRRGRFPLRDGLGLGLGRIDSGAPIRLTPISEYVNGSEHAAVKHVSVASTMALAPSRRPRHIGVGGRTKHINSRGRNRIHRGALGQRRTAESVLCRRRSRHEAHHQRRSPDQPRCSPAHEVGPHEPRIAHPI